jgi:hypothetical protein
VLSYWMRGRVMRRRILLKRGQEAR